MRKKYWLAVGAILVFAVVMVAAIPVFLPPTPGVTYANYSRIEKGMKRSEVVSLLGDQKESPRWWLGDKGDVLEIEFDENDRVTDAFWNGRRDQRGFLGKMRDRFPLIARDPPRPMEVIVF